ncbi:MAG TPA: amidohydrolase family protein [Caldilineaceae bacterium]|nr:amidohydrolase family protein [Caldilineaceae bacterium]
MDLSHLPILDHHAHPLLHREATQEPARFRRWFTESTDPQVHAEHVPHTLFFRTALRWLAELLKCEPALEAILAARARVSEAEWTRRLFQDANITVLLCDYGYGGGEALSHAEMQAALPCRVEPILRLETLAEQLIVQHDTFTQMSNAFVATVGAARSQGYVALKSIIAYRTGLALEPADPAAAEAAFARLKEQARRQGRIRLADKALCDHLVMLALVEAEKQALPVQFHTGFGDADADLRLANPLHLRSVIEQFPTVPLVLLHGGWPYYRELAHLAAIYPNVWLDLSLAVPFATAGIPAMIREVLGMAPLSKVLFATDAFTMPEIYWLAARWGRWGLGQVLDEFVAAGFLTHDEALAAAADILYHNAWKLYRL